MSEGLFGAPVPSDVSLKDMVACVEREISMRRHVYPRWVRLGKLTQAAADMELQRMDAVRDFLNGHLRA